MKRHHRPGGALVAFVARIAELARAALPAAGVVAVARVAVPAAAVVVLALTAAGQALPAPTRATAVAEVTVAAVIGTEVTEGKGATRATAGRPLPAGCPGPWLGQYTNAAPTISADGRFVAWEGYPDPESIDVRNILLRDLDRGTTVSLTRAEQGRSFYAPVISDDGSRVVYSAPATGDPDEVVNRSELLVHDRRTGTTSVEGLARTGDQTDLSADGRTIAFTRAHPADPGRIDVYTRHVDTDAETLVSVTLAGTGGNGFSTAPSLSADGRRVLFSTAATDLTPAAPDGGLLVRDLRRGSTTAVRDASGAVVRAPGRLSPDGRYVAYSDGRVWVHDLRSGRTVAASQAPQESYHVGAPADISTRGRKVTYNANYQVGGDLGDAFGPALVRTVRSGVDTVASAGTDGRLEPWTGSYPGAITPNGRHLVFSSNATNLPGDPDGVLDVFVRDLRAGTTTLVSATDAGGACE